MKCFINFLEEEYSYCLYTRNDLNNPKFIPMLSVTLNTEETKKVVTVSA